MLPHIIFITCHDLGRHLNCYGVSTVHSPNIDRIAAQGVRLANAFCTASLCSPSRASLATGRYPQCSGVMGLTNGDFGWDLHPDELHIAQILREAGYHTALGNFQHESKRDSKALGFDEFAIQRGPVETVAENTVAFLRNRGNRGQRAGPPQPFYLQLGFREAHRNPAGGYWHPADREHGVFVPPYLVDDEEARDDLAEFQGAIRAADAAVGRISAALDELGLADNTLLIMAADHGIPYPRAKGSLYDPGLEVMTILRWPAARWPANGSALQPMISNIDCLPTVLDLIGQSIPERVQGRSFAPLLRRLRGLRGGEQAYTPREEIFGEMMFHAYCDPCRCVRTVEHKLIVNFSRTWSFPDPSQAWRPHTITRVPPDPHHQFHPLVELYDLKADPLETVNLADNAGYAQVRRNMLGRLFGWMTQINDPLLQGIPTPPQYRAAMAVLKSGG